MLLIVKSAGFAKLIKIDYVVNTHYFNATEKLSNESKNSVGIKVYNLDFVSSKYALSLPNTIVLSNYVFWGTLTPYHSEIKELNDLLAEYIRSPNLEKKNVLYNKFKRLRSIIFEMDFSEGFLKILADSFFDLWGMKKESLTIRASTLSEQLDEIVESVYIKNKQEIIKFSELIYSIKWFFSCFFSDEVLAFFIDNKFDITTGSFAAVIQKKFNLNDLHSISISSNVKDFKFIEKNESENWNCIFTETSLQNAQIEYAIDINNNKLYLLNVRNLYSDDNDECPININSFVFKTFKNKCFVRIAIFGVIINKNKVLLLKQKISPFSWRPPGGGLLKNENFVEGLKREIKEDTDMDVEVLKIVDVWKGIHGVDSKVVSLLFLCKVNNPAIKVSKEFTEYKWVPINELVSCSLNTPFDIASWGKYQIDRE